MNENGSIEDNSAGKSSEKTEEQASENLNLTQKAVNEQIEKFIVHLTRQLDELTLLDQGKMTTPNQSHYPKSDYSTISGAAVISVRLSVKTCFWDRQLTYLVRNVMSSPINKI